MDVYETNTHSFIVKIWLEETVEETGRVIWRGHITHVPSGERRALKDLDDILIFVNIYLKQIGVDPGKHRRLRRWLRRWKRL